MFLKNLKIAQKMFWGFGLVIILMGVLLGYIYINFNEQGEVIDLNIESYTLIRESDHLLINLLNMETGARGFAITGEDEFLEPFNKGFSAYSDQISELKNLIGDNELQQARLLRIETSFVSWINYQTNTIISMRRKITTGELTMEDLVAEGQKGIAKGYMDTMRDSLEDISKEEERILQARKENLKAMNRLTTYVILGGGIIVSVLVAIIALLVIRMVVEPVTTVTNTFKDISEGEVNLEARMSVNSKDEIGSMAAYFNLFMGKLGELIKENRNNSWLKSGHAELNEKIRGELDIQVLSANIINYMAKYVDAQIGAIYIRTNNNTYRIFGSYAYKKRKNLPTEIHLGEGVVGQVAVEKKTIVITNVPEEYVSISTGIGEASPRNILVTPCINNGEVVCIIELGSFRDFTDEQLQFIEEVSESIAISINSAESRARMNELLNKTLEQSEELQAQQEELRQNNEELEEQTKALKESEAFMQSQQEELRVINEELEERTKSLELQKKDIISKNQMLQQVQQEIEEKANDLEAANKYKTEFLANMSHELRTPLNSIIVLSQMLAENKEIRSLDGKQIQFINTIHSSGEELLKLINDILDLSKVEAGKLDINLEDVDLNELIQYEKSKFAPIAEKNGLYFNIEIEKDAPLKIVSDSQRLQQIINNLLSNAFKFTHNGGVTLSITSVKELEGENLLAISVKDTGIGIPKDKRELIFEAFKQSDGTTSRKYGGTGLGLSISRQLCELLGGTIKLESMEGKGSTFTIILPEDIRRKSNTSIEDRYKKKADDNFEYKPKNVIIEDDFRNDSLVKEENYKSLLIIEDDVNFANVLHELARERGYSCKITQSGYEGVRLANEIKPDAILLDIDLPDINGWKVIESLKKNSYTKDIPVHIISGKEESDSIKRPEGIVGYLKKPVSLEKLINVFSKIETVIPSKVKKLLIVNDNNDDDIVSEISKKDINVTKANDGKEALRLLKTEDFECMIVDYNLRDMGALELLTRLKDEKLLNLPIIVYTDKELTVDENAELHKYAESIVVKGNKSTDRLIAEASLFLHSIDSKMEKLKIKAIKSNVEREDAFKNKKILIVDDDMRNVFALTSILEEKGLKVVVGRNGKEGIQKLYDEPSIDLVLMDIMMPEMDGYTAIKEIRMGEKYSKVPIIAITAKAMKEDRQKCIEAGADDYLTKPIDVARLISLLRVWLYR